MWGLPDPKPNTPINDNKASEFRLNELLPKLEKHHSVLRAWVLYFLQYSMLVTLLYIMLSPDVKYREVQAITKTLESSAFRNNGISCLETQACTSSDAHLTDRYAAGGTWRDIHTMDDVFLWLRNVVAVYWQAGFAGNFNQYFSLTLTLKENKVIKEENPYFSTMLDQRFQTSGSNQNSKTFEKVFFRSQYGDADLRSVLQNLHETSGWFKGQGTVLVSVVLKLFNGFVTPWITIDYTLKQMSNGYVTKSRDVSGVTLMEIRNLEYWGRLSLVIVISFLILVEVVMEVLTAQRWVTHCRSVSLRTGTTNYILHHVILRYLRSRGVRCLVKALKCFIVFMLLYQMVAYPLGGPRTSVEAQILKHGGVPESQLVFQDLRVFYVISFVVLMLMAYELLTLVKKMHPDFTLLCTAMSASKQLMTRVLSFVVLSLLAISGSSFVLMGKDDNHYSSVVDALISSLHMLFGGEALRLAPGNNLLTHRVTWLLINSLTLFLFHVILWSVCVSTVYTSYMKRQAQNEDDAQSRDELRAWLHKEWTTNWKTNFFWLAGNPVQYMAIQRGDSGYRNDAADAAINPTPAPTEKKGLDGCPTGHGNLSKEEIRWKRNLFAIYVVYFISAVITATLMLDIREQHQHHTLMETLIFSEAIKETFQVPHPPYTKSPDTMLTNRPVERDTSCEGSLNATHMFALASVQDWIRDIVIRRVMDSTFRSFRHATPLCNPLSVYFILSETYDSINPFTKSVWSSRTDSFPSIHLVDIQWVENAYTTTRLKASGHATLYSGVNGYPLFYLLTLAYGETEAVVRDFDRVFDQEIIFNGALRLIEAQWGEYNGDAGVFAYYTATIHVDVSGDLSTKLHTTVFHENREARQEPDAFTFIGNYVNHSKYSLWMCLVPLVVFTGYLGYAGYGWIREQRDYSGEARVLDGLQCVIIVGFFFFLVQSSPSFFFRHNAHDSTGSETLRQKSFSIPSKERTRKIVSDFSVAYQHRTSLQHFMTASIILSNVRLLSLLTSFRATTIAQFIDTLYYVRWNLYIVLSLLLWIGVWQTFSGFLVWGQQYLYFSTIQNAWITSWLLFIPQWSFHHISVAQLHKYLFVFLTLLGIVWTYSVHSLVVAIVCHGLQRLRHDKDTHLQALLQNKWNSSSPPSHFSFPFLASITVRCNYQVMVFWQAVIKNLKSSRETECPQQTDSTDTAPPNPIHSVFQRFLDLPVLSQPCDVFETQVQRHILIEKLTAVQYYLALIVLCECKHHALKRDEERLKEETQQIKRSIKAKQKYSAKLTTKQKQLEEKLRLVQDNISLEKTEFFPDITELRARPVEKENPYVTKEQLDQAKKQFEEHKMHVKRKKGRKDMKQG